MSAAHTPGPWRLEQGSALFIVADGHIGSIAEVRGRLDYSGMHPLVTEAREANARLIAAAPELLAELRKLRRAYVSLLEGGRDRILELGGDCDPVEVMEAASPYLRDAAAAIAKATGAAA